jgi:hypothetical protein
MCWNDRIPFVLNYFQKGIVFFHLHIGEGGTRLFKRNREMDGIRRRWCLFISGFSSGIKWICSRTQDEI